MFCFIAFLFVFNYHIIGILGARDNDIHLDMSNIRYQYLTERDRYIAYGFIKLKGTNNCQSVQSYHLKCIFSDVEINSEDQFLYSHKVYPIICPSTDINVMSDNGFSKYFGCYNEYNKEIVSVDITSLYSKYKSKEKRFDSNTTAIIIVGIVAIFVVSIVGIAAENLSKIKDLVESYSKYRIPEPLPPPPADVLSPNGSVNNYSNQGMRQSYEEERYLYGEQQRAGPNQSVMQRDSEDVLSDSTEFLNEDCHAVYCDDRKSSRNVISSRHPV